MKVIQKIYNGIGWVSDWSARLIMWLLLVLTVSIVYDVVMRYIFNAPTDWSFCLSYMLGAVIVAMGLAYNHCHDFNVRVDMIYTRLSPRGKVIIDILFSLFFLLPLCFMLTDAFFRDVLFAYSTKQIALESSWYPITWPYKAMLVLGFGFLSLQGIATFLKDVMTLAKGGKEPW